MSPITFRPGQLVKISKPARSWGIGVEGWIIADDGFNTEYTEIPVGTVGLYLNPRAYDGEPRNFHRILIDKQLVFVNEDFLSLLKEE